MASTMEYIYNGIHYNITENNATHELLNDAEYFADYIIQHQNEIEISRVEKENATAENIQVAHEAVFTWTAETTRLLVTEYGNRIDNFRDPKMKKKKLWSQICEVFLRQGYTVTEDFLDRKMRNMKHHYKTVKDNNKKSTTGRGRIVWEYFDLFDKIFANDKTINCDRIVSSININPDGANRVQNSSSPSQAIASCSNTQFSLLHPLPQLSLSSTPSSLVSDLVSPLSQAGPSRIKRNNSDNSVFPNIETPTKKQKKAAEGRGLYHLRQRFADIEDRRVKSLEKILEELAENNKIQRERNELLKILLNKS